MLPRFQGNAEGDSIVYRTWFFLLIESLVGIGPVNDCYEKRGGLLDCLKINVCIKVSICKLGSKRKTC
jgi:hypothetical protein